ncbi:MAG: methylated-DNA--[protein]-cysteine S-methyltransferase [Verrucomicrobiota bacterium]
MTLHADYDSPLGRLRVTASTKGIVSLEFVPSKAKPVLPTTLLLKKAFRQLDLYFKGKLQAFDLPLDPTGTPFQSQVWKALSQIPYGETRTYGEIAKKIRSPRASRAVGGACNRNPLLIIVPCHRVVGSTGKLVGFAWGLKAKQALLDGEKQEISASTLQ